MTVFTRVFLIASLFFALFLFFIRGIFHRDDFLNTVLACVLPGLIYGCALGVVSGIYSKLTRESYLTLFIAVIVLQVAGFFICFGIYRIIDQYPEGEWIMMEPPPERAVSFSGNLPYNIWGGEFFVETTDGNIYSYVCGLEIDCEWRKVDDKQENLSDEFNGCVSEQSSNYLTPFIKPGKVIDKYQVEFCGPDYSTQVNYILLDDGTIWTWSRSSSAMEVALELLIWFLAVPVINFIGFIALAVDPKRLWW